MRSNWFTSGQWNAICDVCGFKFKDKDLKDRWDGLKVCIQDWEPRHPQELIRPIATERPVAWTRPEAPDQFIPVTYITGTTCTPEGMNAQADYGSADCATVGTVNTALIP